MEIIEQHQTILLVMALVFGLYMTWGIGANDVANAMGTSVGSGAISIRQAIVLAAIMELCGAYLAGGKVADTSSKGILNGGRFESTPELLVFGMIGALLALQWSNSSLNVYSQIGLITLVGLITKHGILIVEFANQLREQGLETLEAVVKAASQRLRPILMTTGAMVLGAVPLALSTGAGAESRIQIGWVIVGGMSLGTLLTIFVVPTMYMVFARRAVPGAKTAELHEELDPTHGIGPAVAIPVK